MYFVFFLGAEGIWWINRRDYGNIPIPKDIDMFATFTEPCMKEYYRMKEKLQQKREKFENKA